MFSRRFSTSFRSLFYCSLVLAVTVAVLFLINKNLASGTAMAQSADDSVVASPSAVFAGTGVGAIPDGNPGVPPQFNLPLTVSFAVNGLTAPLTSVSVDINITHTWVGDVEVILRSPGGTATSNVVNRIGATPGFFGDESNYAGIYNFTDTAGSTTADNIWTIATDPACGDDCTIPPGNYRATNGTGTFVSLNNAFAGLSTAQINGTWTLTFRDGGNGDEGTVSAANLTLTGSSSTPVPDSLADFDGDGKTEYAVVRTAAGINGQATWWIMNQAYSFYSRDWGIASDTFVPADFDGDGKDDIAIWRPGIQGQFFVIQSQTNTFRVEDWGSGSDDASVVGDYDNDGRDDFAIYRPGATAGAQSYWWWRSSAPANVGINQVAWGLAGDIPAPGDYDGDGKMDYVIQRISGGSGVFWLRYTSGIPDTVTAFGTTTDYVVPGDYDGDHKTDLCVVGTVGGFLQWTFRPSLGGSDVVDTWGLPADIPAPGDYDGDGKADYAVWRFGAQSTFWVMTPVTRRIYTRDWGLIDDTPVTATFAH